MKLEFSWSEYLESLRGAVSASRSASDWTDGESWTSAMHKMAYGDDTYAAMADKLLDEIAEVSEGIPVREWNPSPMGAYAVVPEFIMGFPTCMRTIAPSGELSPVKIVVSSTCSGGIDKSTMTKRGVAILALVRKLQMLRPVELYILVEGNDEKESDNLFQLIRLDTKPLSVAHACFALANVGFARQLTYAHMHHYHGWHGDWPRSYRHSDYEAIVRRECEMSPEDLWIKSSHMFDSLLADNPVAWVNQQIARYSKTE